MGVALITREARRLKPGAPVRKAPGLTTNKRFSSVPPRRTHIPRGWQATPGGSDNYNNTGKVVY